uniref:Uncharacterized protein n=1 Tax=Anguilla anguilla TaxID=7936 RepID=A0A0E9XF58_ANGAN
MISCYLYVSKQVCQMHFFACCSETFLTKMWLRDNLVCTWRVSWLSFGLSCGSMLRPRKLKTRRLISRRLVRSQTVV